MAYINSSTHDKFVELFLATLPDVKVDDIFESVPRAAAIAEKLGTAGQEEASPLAMAVPALTEITVNATPGLYRWKQLDELSEYVITTASTNSLGMSLVLDPTTFFGTDPNSGAEDIISAGIFQTTNQKHLVCFRLYWAGNTPDADDAYYIEGVGYLAGLAPTTNPDAPVWVSPITIEVAGDYVTDKLEAAP